MRVLAPLVVWWLVVLAMGWLLTDGPLKDLGISEEQRQQALESSRTAFWDDVTLFFSWTGATVSIIGVCLVVVALVWWRTKQWWYAVVPLIAISLQALVFFFTTLLIDRERPDVEKLDDSPPTSSFPSGHTGAATGLYFTLALMALRITNPALPPSWWSACAWRSRSWWRPPGSTGACTTSATWWWPWSTGWSRACSPGTGCRRREDEAAGRAVDQTRA